MTKEQPVNVKLQTQQQQAQREQVFSTEASQQHNNNARASINVQMFKAPLLEEAHNISQMDEFYEIEPSLRISLRDSTPPISNKDCTSQLERHQLNSKYAPAAQSPLAARIKVQKRAANRLS